MADVAQLAGVATGTIYTRFGDKNGLLRAVHAEEAGAMQHRILAALELAGTAADPAARVEAAVHAIIDAFREHAPVMRELFRLAGSDDIIRTQGSDITQPIVQAFTDLLTKHGGVRGPDPALIADICFRTVFAACVYRITYGPDSESRRPLPWDVFEAELTRMCLTYVSTA